MSAVGGASDRERIAYRRGFNDGLLVMRESIKNVLLENARLLKPILGPPAHRVSDQAWPDAPVSGADLEAWLAQAAPRTHMAPVMDGHDDRVALVAGNGRERK